MFYILDQNNIVKASCNYLPSQTDLDTRNERYVEDEAEIPAGQAHVVNGKIERKPAPVTDEKSKQMSLIYSRMFKHFANELEAEGEITHPDLIDYKDKTQKDKNK